VSDLDGTSTRRVRCSDKLVVTLIWLFGTVMVLLSSVRTTVSNRAISATLPKIPFDFTPAKSTKSPTSYRRKTSSITPAARSLRSPCKAKPMASEHMESTATKEAVEMLTMEATVMRSKILSPLLAKLTANLMRVGSIRCVSARSRSSSSSLSLASWLPPLNMFLMERKELCLCLRVLIASNLLFSHPAAQLIIFNPIKRTSRAINTVGKIAITSVAKCFNESKMSSSLIQKLTIATRQNAKLRRLHLS